MPEREQTTKVALGDYARGTIEPQPRIDAGEITEAEVDQFVEALTGDEFYDKIDSFMPKCCVDGRHRHDGQCELGANAAGGVFSLLAADMLSTQTFRLESGNTTAYAKHLFTFLNETHAGQFGDHVADAGVGPDDSGCGAIDKMAIAIGLIAQHGDELRGLAKIVGISIADDDFDIIIARARLIADEHDIAIDTGKAMIDTLKNTAGETSAEVLTGVHNEVAVVVNERSGTTLNRAKIKARYGDRLQAFNYDRWAMRKATAAISTGVEGELTKAEEAQRKLAAADLYTLAVTCTLAGASLRGAVRADHSLAA